MTRLQRLTKAFSDYHQKMIWMGTANLDPKDRPETDVKLYGFDYDLHLEKPKKSD
jgi:hypothetical protein